MVSLSPATAAELMETCSMKLEFGRKGDWLVNPQELAPRLGLSTADLMHMDRQGRIDARIAAGVGDGIRQTRVTVRLLDRGWRGIFDESGALVSEEVW
jgi:hypothetical protein